ncbi:hypothetical protein M3Y99_00109200 [Aphelenchoides fujianensis]|nr:hypothetical protein M3Y99_00109200 [Aphelenchoides fujianensis]
MSSKQREGETPVEAAIRKKLEDDFGFITHVQHLTPNKPLPKEVRNLVADWEAAQKSTGDSEKPAAAPK